MKIESVHELLAKINGCTFASMDTVTPVPLKGGKGNPFQGRVHMVQTGGRVMLFTNKKSNGYENMVKRRLEKEGKDPESFHLGNLPWGTRVEGSPIILHNDTYYIQVILFDPGTITYTLDGVMYPAEKIEGLPDPVKTSKSQGIDNGVVVWTIKLENIKALRLFKEEVLEDAP